MKPIVWFFGLICLSPVAAEQLLDDGKVLHFGQTLDEVSAMVGGVPKDEVPPIGRKGVDKRIELRGVTLGFDTGRLDEIKFTDEYGFKNSLTPYKENWKNFEPTGKLKLSQHMTRSEFLDYLALWEEQAKRLGKTKTNEGELTAGQYCITLTKNEFFDMVHITFGPTRSTGKGGLWADGWGISFTTGSDTEFRGVKAGILRSVTAFSDEFNTRARHQDNQHLQATPR
jgi:hypothetical protein